MDLGHHQTEEWLHIYNSATTDTSQHSVEPRHTSAMDDLFHVFVIAWNFIKLYVLATWLLVKDAFRKHKEFEGKSGIGFKCWNSTKFVVIPLCQQRYKEQCMCIEYVPSTHVLPASWYCVRRPSFQQCELRWCVVCCFLVKCFGGNSV